LERIATALGALLPAAGALPSDPTSFPPSLVTLLRFLCTLKITTYELYYFILE